MQLVRKKMQEIHFQHILQVHFIFDYMAFFLNLFTLIMQFFLTECVLETVLNVWRVHSVFCTATM